MRNYPVADGSGSIVKAERRLDERLQALALIRTAPYRVERAAGRWWVVSPGLAGGAYNLWAAQSPAGPFRRVASGVRVTTAAQPGLALPEAAGPVCRLRRLAPSAVLSPLPSPSGSQ